MLVTEYLLHAYQGQQPENEHQYITQHPQEHYASRPEDLERELRNFYSDRVYHGNLRKSQLFAFLDFHRGKYRGEDMDFLDFVRQSPSRVAHQDADEFTHLFFVPGYAQRLGEWLEAREKEAEPFLGGFDGRIAGRVPKDQIEAYFIGRFCRSKDSKGVPYFSEEQVRHFLRANFVDFDPRAEIVKLKSKAIKAQAHVRRTVYAFYLEHSRSNREKRRYCELLRDNFHEFDESDFEETIVKGFSK